MANFIGVSNPIEGRLTEFDAATRSARVDASRRAHPAGSGDRPGGRAGDRRQVTVAVRPERFQIDETRHAEDRRRSTGRTAIRGRVTQGTYLGDQTEYRIDTAEAGELVVRQQNALGATTGRGIGPGDPVVVRWHEEANLILVG